MRIWAVRSALFGVGLGVVGLGLAVALTSQRAHDREVQAQEDALRLRLYDALERKFTAVVDREESRPFLQYSASSDVLANNPVARGEWESAVVGYVQLAPNGRLSTPLQGGQQWLDAWFGEPPAVETRVSPSRTVRVTVPVPEMVVRRVAEPAQVAAVPPPSLIDNSFSGVGNQLNVEGMARQQRSVSNVVAPLEQVQAFTEPANPVVKMTEVDVLAEVPGIPLDTPTGMVDVVVSPMVGGPWSSTVWGLSRDLDINGETWVQTVLFDRAALATSVSETVVRESGLAGVVAVDWSGDDYNFQAPFSGFQARVELLDVASGTSVWVWLLAGLVSLLAVVSLAAVERSMSRSHRLFREREQFIATVTHELKTPVASMQLYAEMLEQGIAETPEQQARYLGVLRRETTRLARLVDQALVLTSRGIPPGAVRLAVAAAVEDTVAAMQPMLAERRVTVHVNVERAEGDVDSDALAQILTNLLDNASKFLRAEDDRTIEVSAVGRRVTVADCGPGIPPVERARVFQPFHRAQDEHTRTTAGTGLGLAVVARLCAQIGARVSIDNRPNSGTIVTVYLAS